MKNTRTLWAVEVRQGPIGRRNGGEYRWIPSVAEPTREKAARWRREIWKNSSRTRIRKYIPEKP